MRVRISILLPGTGIRIRRPGPSERGLWTVAGLVAGSGHSDPAYELRHQRSGRSRILRRSRLRLTRAHSRR
jgi:hypothetical protein